MKTRMLFCVVMFVMSANVWAGLDVVIDSSFEYGDAKASLFQQNEISYEDEIDLNISLLPKQNSDKAFHAIHVSFLADVNPGLAADINLKYFLEEPQDNRIGTDKNTNSDAINSYESSKKGRSEQAESFSTVTDYYTVSDPLQLLFDQFASTDWWDAAAHVYARGKSSEKDSGAVYSDNMDPDIDFLLRHKSDKPFGETDGDDPGFGAVELANSGEINSFESTDMGASEQEGYFSMETGYAAGDPLWAQLNKDAGTGRVLKVKTALVPEPATVALLGVGAIVALRRKRK